jgi:hypothetical protein
MRSCTPHLHALTPPNARFLAGTPLSVHDSRHAWPFFIGTNFSWLPNLAQRCVGGRGGVWECHSHCTPRLHALTPPNARFLAGTPLPVHAFMACMACFHWQHCLLAPKPGTEVCWG